MTTLTALSDGDGGAILEVTDATGKEFVYYAGSVSATNCIAVRSQPTCRVPLAAATTYHVVERDNVGQTIGTDSEAFTPSAVSTVKTDAGGTFASAGTPTSPNSRTITLDDTTLVNRVTINTTSAGVPGTALVWTRKTGEDFKLKGIIGTRTGDIPSGVRTHTTRARERVLFMAPYAHPNPTAATWEPLLAYVKDGTPKGWIFDAYSLYFHHYQNPALDAYDGAKTLTDTRSAMDAVHAIDIVGCNLTPIELLAQFNDAIAALKAEHAGLDQDFVLKVMPLYARAPGYITGQSAVTQWGSLSLAEIQALNTQGAAISEALAGVTLLWATEAHRTVIQKYWYYKVNEWLVGLGNIGFGGFNLLQEFSGNADAIFTSAFKSWLEGIDANAALLQHPYMTGGTGSTTIAYEGSPNATNSHLSYQAPSITFDLSPSYQDARKALNAATVMRTTTSGARGYNVELAQTGVYGSTTEALMEKFNRVVMGCADNIGAAGGPLFTYYSKLVTDWLASSTPSVNALYDYFCEMMLGLKHTEDIAFNYAKVSGTTNAISVSGIDTEADEVKVDWYYSTGSVTVEDFAVGASPITNGTGTATFAASASLAASGYASNLIGAIVTFIAPEIPALVYGAVVTFTRSGFKHIVATSRTIRRIVATNGRNKI